MANNNAIKQIPGLSEELEKLKQQIEDIDTKLEALIDVLLKTTKT